MSTTNAQIAASARGAEGEPSAFDKEPSAFDKEPSAFDKEPSALDQEPSAFDEEPSALDQEPSAFDKEPSAVENQKPSMEFDKQPLASGSVVAMRASLIERLKVIVVGAGPVGVRFVHELVRRSRGFDITVFGDECYTPYNRVQLSALLARDKKLADIDMPLPGARENVAIQYRSLAVTAVDSLNQHVTDAAGERHNYNILVLATGSLPHIPNIPGVELEGVYTFRNLRDTEGLMARNLRSRHTVIVGGGLLGLEAARALLRDHTRITLVQQSDRLMNRQLDQPAAAELRRRVEKLGIELITDSGVRRIDGNIRVCSVTTRDGHTLQCDTVLLCTGIRPNVTLARDAGIKVGSGIVVNDHLRTSVENVFAIGECSEHKGRVYGLVAPGLEQAAVLADNLAQGSAVYRGTQQISQLKVVGETVCSMGEVAELLDHPRQQEFSYRDKKNGDYRKLVLRDGRLTGACAVGAWSESRRIQEAFLNARYLFPWQRWLFRWRGRLWFNPENDAVRAWPEQAIVCQCNQVSRGQLSAAIAQGCCTLEALGKETRAGTVCGTCQPLLNTLIGSRAALPGARGTTTLLWASAVGLLATLLLIFFPAAEAPLSVQRSYPQPWTDAFWKQVTGFSLLGLSLLGLVMSLRKRFGWTFLGNFTHWRLVHVILGVSALGVLFVHTGAHLGVNLNRWLMLNFLAIAAVGAVAGISVALASRSSAALPQKMRQWWFYIHVFMVWPLPVLLTAHVFSVYYF